MFFLQFSIKLSFRRYFFTFFDGKENYISSASRIFNQITDNWACCQQMMILGAFNSWRISKTSNKSKWKMIAANCIFKINKFQLLEKFGLSDDFMIINRFRIYSDCKEVFRTFNDICKYSVIITFIMTSLVEHEVFM